MVLREGAQLGKKPMPAAEQEPLPRARVVGFVAVERHDIAVGGTSWRAIAFCQNPLGGAFGEHEVAVGVGTESDRSLGDKDIFLNEVKLPVELLGGRTLMEQPPAIRLPPPHRLIRR